MLQTKIAKGRIPWRTVFILTKPKDFASEEALLMSSHTNVWYI